MGHLHIHEVVCVHGGEALILFHSGPQGLHGIALLLGSCLGVLYLAVLDPAAVLVYLVAVNEVLWAM